MPIYIKKKNKEIEKILKNIKKRENGKIIVPYRLDKDVNGIIYYFKKKDKNFVYNKKYIAFCYGEIKEKLSVVKEIEKKYSFSIIKPIFYIKKKKITAIKINIITGRKNQIKKHMNFIGLPILKNKNNKFKKKTYLFLYKVNILKKNKIKKYRITECFIKLLTKNGST